MSIETEVNDLVSGISSSDNMQTAKQLWAQYGSGTNFAQWVNNEVVKAKTSGVYKKSMSFQDIVQANLKKANTDNMSNAPSPTSDTPTKKPFTIAGYNGYLVLGGAALAIAGLIYAGTKFFKKK